MNRLQIRRLTRCILLTNVNFLQARHWLRQGGISLHTTVMLAILLMIGSLLMYSYVNLLTKAYRFFHEAGAPSAYLIVFLCAILLLLLLASAFYTVHLFCYSRDYTGLLHMPIEPGTLLTSKLLVSLLLGYTLELLLLVPVFSVYGSHHPSMGFAAAALTIMLFMPVIPSVLLAVIAMLALKVSQCSMRVHPGWLGLAGSLLTVTGCGWLTGTLLQGDVLSKLLHLIHGSETWHYGIALALFAAVSALSLPLYVLASRRWFRSGLYLPMQPRRAAPVSATATRPYSRRTPFVSCFIKELKLFFREPVYVINGLFGIVLPPLMLPLAFSMGSAGEDAGTVREMVAQEPFFSLLLALGVIIATSAINPVASSSVSREGRHFWICRLVPLAWHSQVSAKLAFAYSLSCCGLLMNCFIFWLYFGFSLTQIVIIFSIGSLYAGLWSAIGVWIDTRRPKLNWLNKSEAVKQNLNVVLAMLVSFSLIGLLYYLLTFALEHNWGQAAILLGLAALATVLNVTWVQGIVAMCRKQERHH
ncbi:hypothetical protein [Paenibacillus campinasensis]|uniref:Uncharacterized protein n=1 Tax=Paenibacillus campinasensis TaxID=66347 RepID=A0A268ETM0_9BACL|nr:hypothetical protein [Paenibacillus campinasensis]PAD76473.1 hypothetical protein CHH67_12725 [Paenibacillus campinasensis]